MRRKQMSRALISFVVFLMIGSAGSILAYGQPPIDTPPGIPDADADQNAAMFEDIATRDPSEFNIVYFVSPDSLSDDKHPLGPAALDVLDATIAYEWETFAQSDAPASVQIAIVDSSALGLVDVEWVHDAYTSGVIVVGFDMTYDEMVQLTGDQCSGSRSDTADFGHHYWIFHFTYDVSLGDVPQDAIASDLREAIHETALKTCTNTSSKPDMLSTFRESVAITQGFYLVPVEDDAWLNNFTSLLMFLTYQYGMVNPAIETVGN
ncbi:MAG: hypothetical protein IPK52_24930 [Chloroflexi bacterium]|nr:hypothetical protein [Chloroflexota bacterium]